SAVRLHAGGLAHRHALHDRGRRGGHRRGDGRRLAAAALLGRGLGRRRRLRGGLLVAGLLLRVAGLLLLTVLAGGVAVLPLGAVLALHLRRIVRIGGVAATAGGGRAEKAHGCEDGQAHTVSLEENSSGSKLPARRGGSTRAPAPWRGPGAAGHRAARARGPAARAARPASLGRMTWSWRLVALAAVTAILPACSGDDGAASAGGGEGGEAPGFDVEVAF